MDGTQQQNWRIDGRDRGAILADRWIQTVKLTDGRVHPAILANGRVRAAILADGWVQAAELASARVRAAILANGRVRAAITGG